MHTNLNKVFPRGGGGSEMICPPPMAKIAADLRPSVDSCAARTPLVAGGD